MLTPNMIQARREGRRLPPETPRTCLEARYGEPAGNLNQSLLATAGIFPDLGILPRWTRRETEEGWNLQATMQDDETLQCYIKATCLVVEPEELLLLLSLKGSRVAGRIHLSKRQERVEDATRSLSAAFTLDRWARAEALRIPRLPPCRNCGMDTGGRCLRCPAYLCKLCQQDAPWCVACYWPCKNIPKQWWVKVEEKFGHYLPRYPRPDWAPPQMKLRDNGEALRQSDVDR